jgi:TonB family protein
MLIAQQLKASVRLPLMKSTIPIRVALILMVASIPTALIGQSATNDPVYTVDQVDVRAKVKNQLEHLPDALEDCPIPAGVSLRVVLRKSGKVTDITVVKSSRCSYDREAIKAVKKLKFDPAIKSGQRVSQLSNIEYNTTASTRRR